MCNDTIQCLKSVHKKAMRTLETLVEDSDSEFKTPEIDKAHHLLEIIKDSAKLIASEEPQE